MISVWLSGLAGVSILFIGLWLIEIRDEDASLVDAGWAASLGGLAACYAWLGSGSIDRRLLLAAVVGAWSVRLTAHILSRHVGAGEDGRYRALRRQYGPRAHRFFLVFYQAQGLLAALLSLPFLLMAFDSAPRLHTAEIVGFSIASLAIALEALADRQLEAHRSNPDNRKTTCRSGLWRYSRHPNYFFEWLVWCGFALAASDAPFGLAAFASPALMLFLILKVTGIPKTEERALESRGEDYRRYQESTSAFIPWFPRHEASS